MPPSRCQADIGICVYNLGVYDVCHGEEEWHTEKPNIYLHPYNGRCGKKFREPNRYGEILCEDGHNKEDG